MIEKRKRLLCSNPESINKLSETMKINFILKNVDHLLEFPKQGNRCQEEESPPGEVIFEKLRNPFYVCLSAHLN